MWAEKKISKTEMRSNGKRESSLTLSGFFNALHIMDVKVDGFGRY
jgi:hypothetical protein